jgi:hypothetical protein
MNSNDFHDYVHEFLNEVATIITGKNGEYADQDDCLANFRESADFLGLTMFDSLLPHMHKHYRAIVKGFDTYDPDELRGRLIDLCAYAIFTDIIKNEESK